MMEKRCFLIIMLVKLIWSEIAKENYQDRELNLSVDLISEWSREFSTQLDTISKNLTVYDNISYEYSTQSYLDDVDGTKLVQSMATKVGKLLADKVDAVKKLVEKAEELYANYTSDDNLDFDYLNNKKLLSDTELHYMATIHKQSVTEMEQKFRSVWLEPSSQFNQIPVNNGTSTVHVPTNVFDKSSMVMNTAYWSKELNCRFRDNSLSSPPLKWQYFCSSSGMFRVFPGMKWPRDNSADSGIDFFDCRVRNWYLQAATCRKNVVILIDTSGSMKGLRMQIARSTVQEILKTLTDDDYFTIIRFSDYVEYVDSCFNGTMMSANTQNKERLTELMKDEVHAENAANFEKAFQEAFDLLKREEGQRSHRHLCNKAILLVTDGVPQNYEWVFKANNWPNKTIRVFTYLIGREVSDNREVKWLACANKGFYSHISTLSDVKENIQNYIKVLSRPMVIDNYHHMVWTSMYLDHVSQLQMDKGLKFMTSVVMPVFDLRNDVDKEKKQGNLLGVMGTDIPVDDIIKHIQTYKLGANGYAFLINHNGYVLFHPDFRPYITNHKTESMTLNPNYQNIDLMDVVLPTNRDAFEEMRENMLSSNTGSKTLELLVHYDEMKRMVKRQYSFFYQKIADTNFTLGIAMPTINMIEVQTADILPANLQKYARLNGTALEIAPWKYCDSLEERLRGRDRVAQLLKLVNNGDTEYIRAHCDWDLVNHLIHDSYASRHLPTRWQQMNTDYMRSCGMGNLSTFDSLGIELVFIGTKGGLTRYMLAGNQSHMYFLGNSSSTTEANYYMRAVEGEEQLANQPQYTFTYSVPINLEFNINSTVVTASAPIVVHRSLKMGVAATVGLQMKYKNFAKLFNDVTTNKFHHCNHSPCLSCKHESVSCFLLDNHGYIMASKNSQNISQFFGYVEPDMMTELIINKQVFIRHNFTDYQSICDIKASDKERSSGCSLLNPLQALFKGLVWTITEVALFFAEFSFRSLWYGVRNAFAAPQMYESPEDMHERECAHSLADYDYEEMNQDERASYNQLLSRCYSKNNTVIGHRACHQSFAMYHSNVRVLMTGEKQGTIQGSINNCYKCVAFTSPCPENDSECQRFCLQEARPCLKSYVVSWVKDTNLLLVVVARDCICDDIIDFALQHREIPYTSEETCQRLHMHEGRYRDTYSKCHDYSDKEDETRCGAASMYISQPLLLLLVVIVYSLHHTCDL